MDFNVKVAFFIEARAGLACIACASVSDEHNIAIHIAKQGVIFHCSIEEFKLLGSPCLAAHYHLSAFAGDDIDPLPASLDCQDPQGRVFGIKGWVQRRKRGLTDWCRVDRLGLWCHSAKGLRGKRGQDEGFHARCELDLTTRSERGDQKDQEQEPLAHALSPPSPVDISAGRVTRGSPGQVSSPRPG